jgi:hypothetical protein
MKRGGGHHMVLRDKADRIVDADDGATNEEPLLSGGGRDFLNGKIGADEYFGAALRIAAAEARRDINSDLTKQRFPIRKYAEIVLFLAAVAYGILGAATLISGKGASVGVGAITTAVALVLTGLLVSAKSTKLVDMILDEMSVATEWLADFRLRFGTSRNKDHDGSS